MRIVCLNKGSETHIRKWPGDCKHGSQYPIIWSHSSCFLTAHPSYFLKFNLLYSIFVFKSYRKCIFFPAYLAQLWQNKLRKTEGQLSKCFYNDTSGQFLICVQLFYQELEHKCLERGFSSFAYHSANTTWGWKCGGIFLWNVSWIRRCHGSQQHRGRGSWHRYLDL